MMVDSMLAPNAGFGAGAGGALAGMTGSVAGGSTGVSLKEVTKIRTEFPETWLWVNSTTG